MNTPKALYLIACLAVLLAFCTSKQKTVQVEKSKGASVDTIGLETLLKPTGRVVVSSIPVVALTKGNETFEIEVSGLTAYNTNFTGSISARTAGRIEKLYLKYNFQDVAKGQKVMEIYSPEMLTAQENLTFILKNDALNSSLIAAAEQKLLLLGFPSSMLQQLVRSRKSFFTVPVFSNYSGHIHDIGSMPNQPQSGMEQPVTTPELIVKEGMYVTKGQTLFKVFNPDNLWVLLSVFPGQQALVKKGQPVQFRSEDYPGKIFTGQIDYIEPFYREGTKTLTARATMHAHNEHLPVGVQLKGAISATISNTYWLPREAVLSLGVGSIVLVKSGGAFKAQQVKAGYQSNNKIQIVSGLASKDSVAANAQYLMDSEGFIKTNL